MWFYYHFDIVFFFFKKLNLNILIESLNLPTTGSANKKLPKDKFFKKKNSQTQKGIEPPHMKVESKINMIRLQPQKRLELNFFGKMINRVSLFRKTRVFLSCQMTQTHDIQIRWRTERIFLKKPPNDPNWSKWSELFWHGYLEIDLILS